MGDNERLKRLSGPKVRVLELISRLGQATREQVVACYWKGSSATTVFEYLKYLEDQGYISSVPIEVPKKAEKNRYVPSWMKAYIPTRKGNNYLAFHIGIPRDRLIRVKEVNVTHHNLGANEPIIKAHQLIRMYPHIKLLEYDAEPLFKRETLAGLVPDAWMKLGRGERVYPIAFEWDLDTIAVNNLPERLGAYTRLVTDRDNIEAYKQRFQTDRLLSAWIVPSQVRLMEVLGAAESYLHNVKLRELAWLFRFRVAGVQTEFVEFYFGANWYQPFERTPLSLLPKEWESVTS